MMKARKKAAFLCVLLVLCGLVLSKWLGVKQGMDSLVEEESKRGILSLRRANEENAERLPSKRQRPFANDRELSAHPSFELFNDALQANRELLTWGGLKPDQFEEFDQLLQDTWTEISADLRNRAALVEDAPGINTSVRPLKADLKVYLIEGSPDQARDRVLSLSRALTEKFGRGAASRLTPYISRMHHMAGLGDQTLRLSFYREIDETGYSYDMATVEIMDKESGDFKDILKGGRDKDSLYKLIGPAFGTTFGKHESTD
jgi:hypothetical protein